MAEKIRLDRLLVDKGLVATRERAQAMVLAGRVLVQDQKVEKPGASVSIHARVRLLGEDLRYVSRGGLKLECALTHWNISLEGRSCADIGTSTGGFTDCMLQHGAESVVCVDTGYGQIAQKLRDDNRVILRERTNARYLKPGDLPPGISFLAMDVSFIAASLVLPSVIAAVRDGRSEARVTSASTIRKIESVVLVKPQFEAGKEHVGKGGIVRDERAHRLAIERVRETLIRCGAEHTDVVESPITGAEGNREFLMHALFDYEHNGEQWERVARC